MSLTLFLGYANIKDLDGTVTAFHTALERAIKGRFDMDVKIFMDNRDIQAGDQWENNLSTELSNSTVLLILLSPVWLSRKWCRAEYKSFKSTHLSNSNKGIIIPILWVDTEISDAKNDEGKEIILELKKIEMVDWRDLQYDRNYESSTELRKAIGKLADGIKIKILKEIE